MLQMTIPWWEFIVRASIIFVFLMIVLRISGKRQVGQLAPFDLVLLLLLSNSVQNSMNGGDNSLVGGMISAVSLILLNLFLSFISSRSKKIEEVIEGHPVILIHNGKCYTKILARENISRHDLDRAVREAGLGEIQKVKLAILETNGVISIIGH